MDTLLLNNHEFMTSSELTKKIAKKIKIIRKKRFKTQAEFAQHIGMSYGTYARFEKTGQVSFLGFIDILKGIDRVDDIANAFDENSSVIEW